MEEEKETGIVSAICEYLQIKGHFFWRQNTAALYRQGRFFRMPRFSRNGVPDIILVSKGDFIGIEVKRNKGRQSVAQKEFQTDLEKAGGRYHLVHSIDEVIALGL